LNALAGGEFHAALASCRPSAPATTEGLVVPVGRVDCDNGGGPREEYAEMSAQSWINCIAGITSEAIQSLSVAGASAIAIDIDVFRQRNLAAMNATLGAIKMPMVERGNRSPALDHPRTFSRRSRG
jgi:hypothetical protein